MRRSYIFSSHSAQSKCLRTGKSCFFCFSMPTFFFSLGLKNHTSKLFRIFMHHVALLFLYIPSLLSPLPLLSMILPVYLLFLGGRIRRIDVLDSISFSNILCVRVFLFGKNTGALFQKVMKLYLILLKYFLSPSFFFRHQFQGRQPRAPRQGAAEGRTVYVGNLSWNTAW